MSDPFLFEALEGLEEVQADHERVVAELELELRPKVVGRKRWKAFRWVAAASILLVGSAAAWLLAGEDDRNLEHVAAVMQEVQADSAVPAVGHGGCCGCAGIRNSGGKGGRESQRPGDTAVRPKERKVAAYPVERGKIAGGDAVAVAEADFAGDTAVVAEDSLEMRNSVAGMLGKRLEHVNAREGVSDDKSGVRIRGISPAGQQPPRKKPGERREEEVISYVTIKKGTRNRSRRFRGLRTGIIGKRRDILPGCSVLNGMWRILSGIPKRHGGTVRKEKWILSMP